MMNGPLRIRPKTPYFMKKLFVLDYLVCLYKGRCTSILIMATVYGVFHIFIFDLHFS